MKLIGSSSSPYVRKVRVVMAEKKLDYDFVLEDVWSADTQIIESNPLGKVPCLIMEGAEALFDSRVIVEYLDTLSPVGKLIPSVGRERAEVKTWEALSDGVLDAAILARLEATWPGRTGSGCAVFRRWRGGSNDQPSTRAPAAPTPPSRLGCTSTKPCPHSAIAPAKAAKWAATAWSKLKSTTRARSGLAARPRR